MMIFEPYKLTSKDFMKFHPSVESMDQISHLSVAKPSGPKWCVALSGNALHVVYLDKGKIIESPLGGPSYFNYIDYYHPKKKLQSVGFNVNGKLHSVSGPAMLDFKKNGTVGGCRYFLDGREFLHNDWLTNSEVHGYVVEKKIAMINEF